MEDKKKRAIELFRKSYNCSQAVFASRADLAGVSEKDALKIAAGFGAGIARTQGICGACSGAIMLLGARFHDDADVPASKSRVYDIVKSFLKDFETLHGSTECLTILGVDLNTEEGKVAAKEQRLFETKCERFVIDAGNLVDKYLR